MAHERPMTHRPFTTALAVFSLALLTAASARAELVWYSPLDGDATATVGSDGVATGAPTATADRFSNAGSAVLFDGDEFFTISPEVSALSAGTLSVWVRNDTTSTGERGAIAVGASGGGETEYFTIMRQTYSGGNDTWRTDLDDGDNGIGRIDAATGGVSQGAWHHLAATFDNGVAVRLYVDGVLVDTGSLAGGEALLDGTVNDWLIGAERTTERFFIGAIDDAAIYTHALTDTQIAQLYGGAFSPLDFTPPDFSGIAKDSFQTTEDGDAGAFYDDGGNLANNPANEAITAGTVGFSASKVWTGSVTGNIRLDNDGPASAGLEHGFLGGELAGALEIKAKDPRVAEREVDATIPVSDTYWMSMLLHSTKVEATNVMSMGFNDGAADRSSGLHIGFNGDQIAVFAGGTTFDLLTYELGETYLVVLELDVDASGDETLTAWIGADGDPLLAFALKGVSVETWASTADLGWLELLIDGSNVDTDDRLWWFDEVRLATTVGGLGVQATALAPTPGALSAGLALLGLAAARRRRRAA